MTKPVKRRKMKRSFLLFVVVLMLTLSGCSMVSRERVKLKDLEMTILSEEVIAQELMTILDEKKEKAFRSSVKSVGNSIVGTVGREVGKTLGSTLGGSFGRQLGGNVGASLGRSILGTFLKG